ncbi:MAG: nuclear transport factor 2 family protein [Enterococcus malodoratus]|uniref:nuclear transport factor 2 family protein n=1 Tax=Enterococcus malodoratus TaxID=71451 RepID=UPI0020740D45|nr:nuclear transport factor 2 family protein [Enterococcus malodoratus]
MRRKIIEQFVEAINQQNVPRLIEMMAEDFQFIDTYGKSENKEAMKSGWPGYFEWFPDYQIEIEEYLANESCAVLIGRASGSYLGQAEKQWAFPAAWKVVAADQQIKIWQVFCDSKKQLDSMK